MPDKLYKEALFKDVSKIKPSKETKATLDYITPHFNKAIKRAEGNRKNFGILSVPVSSPEVADKSLNQSVYNNYLRWIEAGKPNKFVDFFRDRWAPLGAENDPKNLNQNWAPNVRESLKEQLGPEEYERWKRYNLVKIAKETYNG